MTNGSGAENSTLFYLPYLFRQAFNYYHMGYVSAMARVLFVIILVLTMLVLKFSAMWVYYEGERRGKRPQIRHLGKRESHEKLRQRLTGYSQRWDVRY